MRKKLVPIFTLIALFLIPVVLGFTHYNGQKKADSPIQYESNNKEEKASTTTITDSDELKEYAKKNGLSTIPTKVETEYNGPK